MELGRTMFDALTYAELGLTVIGVALFVWSRPPRRVLALGVVLLALLALQQLWFHPVLVAQMQLIIDGADPPRSPLHIAYITAEVVKLGVLMAIGVSAGAAEADAS